MKRFMPLLCLAAWLCSILSVQAQTPATPSIGPLRPYLDTLSFDEKAELLDYMRHIGLSIDRELAQSYLQLEPKQQQLALQYIRVKLRTKIDPADDRTTVRIAQDTLRFGDVNEGDVLRDSFLITNTGMRPYVIHGAKASCDCTVLRRPEFAIMPGETIALQVEFDTRGKVGLSTPGIILYDNTRPNSRQIVYLSANIIPRVKPKDNTGN